MKILLSMPSDKQSNVYIMNALSSLGHNVYFIDHRTELNNAILDVPEIILNFNPDIMLVLYLVPNHSYMPSYIRMLKKQFPKTRFISWIFDTTINGEFCDKNIEFINLVKEYDFFFTVVRGQVNSFRAQGVNAFFIPEGFDPNTPLSPNIIEQDIDVSFIGQLGYPEIHKGRIEVLEKILDAGFNLKLYGPHYHLSQKLLSVHEGRPTNSDLEHSVIVSKSKINLGLSGWTEIDGYFSARNYRIMGSGGFLVANRGKNIEEFFEEDKEIVLFDTPDECVSKITTYLNNPDMRKKISISGQKRVIENYTFRHSFLKMFDIMTVTLPL
jgi:hypothetical protein